MQSTYVSCKHLKAQIQLRFIVKKELVATYGYGSVVSVFGAKTLKVAQQPSTFSTLKTLEVTVSAGSYL